MYKEKFTIKEIRGSCDMTTQNFIEENNLFRIRRIGLQRGKRINENDRRKRIIVVSMQSN